MTGSTPPILRPPPPLSLHQSLINSDIRRRERGPEREQVSNPQGFFILKRGENKIPISRPLSFPTKKGSVEKKNFFFLLFLSFCCVSAFCGGVCVRVAYRWPGPKRSNVSRFFFFLAWRYQGKCQRLFLRSYVEFGNWKEGET